MHPVGRGGRDASKRPTVPTARMLTELRKVRNPALNGTSGPRAAQSLGLCEMRSCGWEKKSSKMQTTTSLQDGNLSSFFLYSGICLPSGQTFCSVPDLSMAQASRARIRREPIKTPPTVCWWCVLGLLRCLFPVPMNLSAKYCDAYKRTRQWIPIRYL